jgi:hypothetical protein
MSKTARTKAKKKRLEAKRSRKEAQQKLYETRARLGQNKKSKRFRKKARKKTVSSKDHPDGPCGNIGCSKCAPLYNLPMYAKPRTALYGKNFYGKAA